MYIYVYTVVGIDVLLLFTCYSYAYNRLVQCLDKGGVLHEGQAGF